MLRTSEPMEFMALDATSPYSVFAFWHRSSNPDVCCKPISGGASRAKGALVIPRNSPILCAHLIVLSGGSGTMADGSEQEIRKHASPACVAHSGSFHSFEGNPCSR